MTGMPNITLSASSPPTPQASTPMPLIIGVWLSVPISVSGTAQAAPSRFSVVTTVASRSRLIVCMMPVPGGCTRTSFERARRPLHEAVALGVALELALHVARQERRASVVIDRDRVVDRDVDRQHRVEPRRIAAGLGERRPHARRCRRAPARRWCRASARGPGGTRSRPRSFPSRASRGSPPSRLPRQHSRSAAARSPAAAGSAREAERDRPRRSLAGRRSEAAASRKRES